MNWLDLVLIAVVIVFSFMGMKTGLIGAAFVAAGAYVGWILGNQFSDDIGGIFDSSLTNDTMISVAAYSLIIASSVVVFNYLVKFARPMLAAITLGLSSMADRLGGITLGLSAGLAISGILIITLARLTYNFDTIGIADGLTSMIPGQEIERIPVLQNKVAVIVGVQEQLESSLTNSRFVPMFISLVDAIPANALGLISSDFEAALDILELHSE